LWGLAAFPAWAEDMAADKDKAAAADLLKKGEAERAYELYMGLFRADPEDDAVVLGMSRAATAAKRWNQAVMAYEILLEKYPADAGLYSELANVYMLLGDRDAADRCLAMMRSLDGKSTKAETDKALDVLEKRYGNFQIYGKVRAGIQYDSNANMGPDSNELDLGDWRVTLYDAEAKGSFGASAAVDVNISKRFFRDSSWYLVGDAQGFWRGHAESSLDNTHSLCHMRVNFTEGRLLCWKRKAVMMSAAGLGLA
jgi:tetratricopeptide (TPR) repeat protein